MSNINLTILPSENSKPQSNNSDAISGKHHNDPTKLSRRIELACKEINKAKNLTKEKFEAIANKYNLDSIKLNRILGKEFYIKTIEEITNMKLKINKLSKNIDVKFFLYYIACNTEADTLRKAELIEEGEIIKIRNDIESTPYNSKERILKRFKDLGCEVEII